MTEAPTSRLESDPFLEGMSQNFRHGAVFQNPLPEFRRKPQTRDMRGKQAVLPERYRNLQSSGRLELAPGAGQVGVDNFPFADDPLGGQCKRAGAASFLGRIVIHASQSEGRIQRPRRSAGQTHPLTQAPALTSAARFRSVPEQLRRCTWSVTPSLLHWSRGP